MVLRRVRREAPRGDVLVREHRGGVARGHSDIQREREAPDLCEVRRGPARSGRSLTGQRRRKPRRLRTVAAGRLGADVGVLHVAAIGLVVTHEERLERRHDLSVERALLVGLHVRLAVPQAHREAGVLVPGVLREPAAAKPLEPLALGEDVRAIGALELVPRTGAKLTPGNADHHDWPPVHRCASAGGAPAPRRPSARTALVSTLGPRRLWRRTRRRIELNAVPERVGHGPGAKDRRELGGILDGAVHGAKLEDGAGLLGPHARKLEELGGIGEIDLNFAWHGRLLHQSNARPGLVPTMALLVLSMTWISERSCRSGSARCCDATEGPGGSSTRTIGRPPVPPGRL